MSSQNKGISLRHTPDNIGYRLIEIPAELQELLESSTPPMSVPIPCRPTILPMGPADSSIA